MLTSNNLYLEDLLSQLKCNYPNTIIEGMTFSSLTHSQIKLFFKSKRYFNTKAYIPAHIIISKIF
jgi:hypothetical protein